MKSVLVFILCGLFAYGCNRIDFSNDEDRSPHNYVTDYQLHSCAGDSCQDKDSFSEDQIEKTEGDLIEHFKVTNRDQLEIILVVDVSGSMDDDLKAVGSNMTSLLSYIEEKKWRMAFTTADHGDHDRNNPSQSERWQDYTGSLPRFGQFMPLEKEGQIGDQKILDKHTSNYTKVFRDTLTRESSDECHLPPFCQGHNEQPLRALKAAIQRAESDRVHQEFFKPNTDTVVIIVTDEDERRQEPLYATKAREVLQTYSTQFKGQKKRLFGFSISIQDEACFKQEKGSSGWFAEWFDTSAANYGRGVARLADITGGSNISLCEKNYSVSLRDISERTRKLVHSVTLREMFYIPDTVEVELTPNQPNISWKLYGRSLVFSGELLPETKITVHYRYEQ